MNQGGIISPLFLSLQPGFTADGFIEFGFIEDAPEITRTR
jgi:hypothetical protein